MYCPEDPGPDDFAGLLDFEHLPFGDMAQPGVPRSRGGTFSERQLPRDGADPPPERLQADPGLGEPIWLCLRCDSDRFVWTATGWTCAACDADQFYDSNLPARRESANGSWVYMPRRSPSSSSSGWTPSAASAVPPLAAGRPPSGASSMREEAESETVTNDPSVNPDNMMPNNNRRRRRTTRTSGPHHEHADRSKGAVAPHDRSKGAVAPRGGQPAVLRAPPGLHDEQVQPLDTLIQSLPKHSSKDSEWNSLKGPRPGVKFRGGTPPSPPVWSYSRDDLRAFQKWERKVRIWELQVASYVPANEASMLLYVSLRGEAEEEMEHCDLESINHKNGVNYIIESLRAPLMTRAVYLKRRYLHEYELLQRVNGESIRSFCNRYHRVERSLMAVNVDVGSMYDSESRGSRLLDRMRLSLEQQRLVLVGSGQSLHFESIKEAAQLQFPEHRPVPQITYSREFDTREHREPRHPGAGDHPRAHGYPPRDQGKGRFSKGRGKGDGKGKGYFTPKHTTYIAEADPGGQEDFENNDDAEHEENPDEALEEIPEGDEGMINEEDDADSTGEGIQDVMNEVAECLTVTARRLQGVTLGRKFSGRRPLDERKRTSHCAACGEKGHWQGDAACSMSKKNEQDNPAGGKGGFSKGNNARDGAKGNGPKGAKKVMTVQHACGTQSSVSFEDEEPAETFGSYFNTLVCYSMPTTNPIHKVFTSSLVDFAGHVVLDTACQKVCCSEVWLQQHLKILNKLKLHGKNTPEKEGFQFGHGDRQYSFQHTFFPACFNGDAGTNCLIGASVLGGDNDIPLLGSLSLIAHKWQATLDFPNSQMYLGVFDCTVPIVCINGHLTVRIDQFPEHVNKCNSWSRLSMQVDQDPDPEFVCLPDSPHAPAASGMARELETTGEDRLLGRAAAAPFSVPDGQAGPSPKELAMPSGPEHDGGSCAGSQGNLRTLSAPSTRNATLREPARQVLQVPRLRSPVAMERKGGRLGGGLRNFILSTTAAILGTICATGSSTDLGKELAEVLHSEPATSAGQEQVHGQSFSFEDHEGLHQQETFHGGGRPGVELRLGSGGSGRPSMKKGQKVWISGQLRQACNVYSQEVSVYEAMPTYHQNKLDQVKIDLCEVFSGTGNLTSQAYLYGLSALQPFDIREGYDLSTEYGKDILWKAVKKYKPLLVVVAWPCKLWSLFNENMNWSQRLDELHALRAAEFGGFWRCPMQVPARGEPLLPGREPHSFSNLGRFKHPGLAPPGWCLHQHVRCWRLWSREFGRCPHSEGPPMGQQLHQGARQPRQQVVPRAEVLLRANTGQAHRGVGRLL